MKTVSVSSYETVYCIDSKMWHRKYLDLAGAEGAEKLSDAAAVKFVSGQFGFDENRIEIEHHAVLHVYTGESTTKATDSWIPREPYYAASDWNYIRFRVCGKLWEVVNGDLEMVAE